jgi:hypothetical protein
LRNRDLNPWSPSMEFTMLGASQSHVWAS